MLKKFQREKDRERQKMGRENQRAAPTIPLCPADAAGGGGSGLTDPLLNLIGSTTDHALIQAASTVDFDIDLDSLLDVTEETMSPNSLAQSATDTQLILPSQAKPEDHTQFGFSCHAQGQPSSSKTKMNVQPKPHPLLNQLLFETVTTSPQSVPLPEGLPAGLEGSIGKLMLVRLDFISGVVVSIV